MLPLTDKTKTPEPDIEDKERVYAEGDPVLDHSRSAEDTNSRCQGPSNKNNVDRNASDCRQADGAEQRRQSQGEERVADDGYRLHE